MTASTFPGFVPGTEHVGVPSPLLSSLLVEITNPAELKCTLRFLWFEAQQSGIPRRVPVSTLRTDGILLAALGSEEEVELGIALAVERRTLIESNGWLLRRNPQNERAAEQLGPAPVSGVAASPTPSDRPNVFRLYEENIGMLTPMVADELRAAEEEYPADWIADAMHEAVRSNVRSWRYVVKVLERWKREGRGARSRGKSGGHTETLTAEQILARLHRS